MVRALTAPYSVNGAFSQLIPLERCNDGLLLPKKIPSIRFYEFQRIICWLF